MLPNLGLYKGNIYFLRLYSRFNSIWLVLFVISTESSCCRITLVFLYWRTLKTHHHIFALILQTVYVIEKLLAGFNVQLRAQELEVRSFNHPYNLKTKGSQCHYYVLRNDIMRFSVLGFRSEKRIELQAPVLRVVNLAALSREAAYDVTCVHTASSGFLHS